MATLINGNGNPAIYAAQDADLIASLAGNITGIAKVGNEFAYTAEDANTISVADGVIVTKEGRRIQLDAGENDTFTIPAGTAGVTNYYIIGYHLHENASGQQVADTFVQLMASATDTIQEDTLRGGASDVYVSLYRVEQDGVNLGTITLLLPKLANISQVNSDLVNHHCERVVKTLGSLSSFTVNCGFKPKKVTCYSASELTTISSIGIGSADKSSMCSFTMNDGSHGSAQGNQGVIGELYYDASNYRVLQIDSITDTSITFTVSGSGYGGDSRTAIWDLYIE